MLRHSVLFNYSVKIFTKGAIVMFHIGRNFGCKPPSLKQIFAQLSFFCSRKTYLSTATF